MKPDDLAKGLQSAFEQAHQLQKASNKTSTGFHRIPHITVSILYCFSLSVLHIKSVLLSYILDELNASTCGDLFKYYLLEAKVFLD